jgi:hypothetical protein
VDRIDLQDGLYRVIYGSICAGFIIKEGRLVECAPVLVKKFGFWKTMAVRICD